MRIISILIRLAFVAFIVWLYGNINDYDICYTEREYKGKAIFNMCSGNLSAMCHDCPYYAKEE